ncbi:sensor histidine kinase [Microbacterium protaetiae]|uniref:histidine kinase n=1 Tax=Microbacterium protaetiae TaxID=2509458 RepID=A0A4P6EIG7_9MICO|nr:histidine kinase [Microbacterium protaetiae]QAY61363.1 sensor histidine kinase [Microbacterium protaetiae]
MHGAWRRAGWRGTVFDVAPAAGLWVAGVLDIVFGLSESVGAAPVASSFVPMTVICALLVLRRRFALLVQIGVAVVIAVPVWVVPLALGYWGEFIPWLVALYSCARHEERMVRQIAGAVVSAVTLTVISLRFPEMADPGDLLYDGVLLAAAFTLGLFARSWARYRDGALRQELERAQADERAATQERARIARELHDVISHTITVIVMQAGGARLAAASDPSVAVEALARIEGLGRESLNELRTLLEVLREDGQAPEGTAPQPTLSDVDALCAQMRELGLPVQLHTEGVGAALAPSIQLAGYRIVQEGLTNVLKHAGNVDTGVRLASSGGVMTIEVSCAPGAGGSSLGGTDHGLLGLRERVAALGGTLMTGPRADGGYLLRAELPLEQRVS